MEQDQREKKGQRGVENGTGPKRKKVRGVLRMEQDQRGKRSEGC